ncbi:segregation/condensation protein A [Laspinema sp. A4]|uniref:segregation/condensation protein A n=1 Tax=Laspinema sp. D2d TaxID=2953686 RepID=UPI0021BAAA49|nr:ScpA family protein [Laspinema sp. D2d]MCT7984614.1 segregation/condensation protein A [Laspinema sp. D2d]
MTGSLAQNAISLLIELAQTGEIDPWDVQVIEVIDRYLSRLSQVHEAGRVEREAALSETGQAFLYASMLVLLKADALARSESLLDDPNASEEEDGELLDPMDGEGQGGNVPRQLELQLKRRAVAPTPKKRRVTLQELIEQLQLMSMAIETPPRRRAKRHGGSKSTASTVRALTELAEQENISEVADRLTQFLLAYAEKLDLCEPWLELEALLEGLMDQRGDRPSGESVDSQSLPTSNDRVGVFSALLLLSAQSKVELSQEQFYGDLKIRAIVDAVPLDSPPTLNEAMV